MSTEVSVAVMKFKTRFTVMFAAEFEAASAMLAAQMLGEYLRTKSIDGKVLGIIPADQAWPDEAETTKRPPRNTPPGGSPGTPTLDAQPELVQAVAA